MSIAEAIASVFAVAGAIAVTILFAAVVNTAHRPPRLGPTTEPERERLEAETLRTRPFTEELRDELVGDLSRRYADGELTEAQLEQGLLELYAARTLEDAQAAIADV